MRIAAASGARAEHLKKFFRMDVGHIETGVELIGRLDAMNDGTRGRPSGFVPFTFRDSRNLIKSKPPTSFSETFAIALQNFLKDGVTDLGTISAQLHLDRRTLQRRLRAEGTSFGEMLEAARRQLAESLLVDADFTVDEIAKAVGYTSKQHLIRAFKKWTGVTPGTFRHMSRKV
jgi:AraC-like DNA-binding protein